jgi:hypothetical protein
MVNLITGRILCVSCIIVSRRTMNLMDIFLHNEAVKSQRQYFVYLSVSARKRKVVVHISVSTTT